MTPSGGEVALGLSQMASARVAAMHNRAAGDLTFRRMWRSVRGKSNSQYGVADSDGNMVLMLGKIDKANADRVAEAHNRALVEIGHRR